MISDTLLEQILLNLGDKAPWLLVFLIFVRFMWPDIVKLVGGFVDFQTARAEKPDHVAQKLDNLTTNVATLVVSLNAFVGEYRAYVMPRLAAVSSPAQPPVSPNLVSGETVQQAGAGSGSSAVVGSEPGGVPHEAARERTS